MALAVKSREQKGFFENFNSKICSHNFQDKEANVKTMIGFYKSFLMPLRELPCPGILSFIPHISLIPSTVKRDGITELKKLTDFSRIIRILDDLATTKVRRKNLLFHSNALYLVAI